MLSFINEIDDPIVQRDILDLNRRILLFREGKINEESFRSLRLARGVYGQRQPGVQMIRIKVPMGLLTFDQFRAILDVCDEYSTGKYHLTTRQDIQIHHVKLEDSPALWAQLEASEVTLREACGNTVRNVTASPLRDWTLTNRSMCFPGRRLCGGSFCGILCVKRWAGSSRCPFRAQRPTPDWA